MKKLIALAILVGLTGFTQAQSIPFPGPGLSVSASAVALDAKGTSNCYAPTATSITCSTLTVGTGLNRALVAVLGWSSAPTSPACTWDSGGTNQSMTLIQQSSNTRAAAIFGLVAPTSGNKTLSCSWAGAITDTFVDAISFNNVNQTGGSTTFYNPTAGTGSSGAPSVTVVSATTDAAVDIATNVTSGTTPSQTQLFKDSTHGSAVNAGSSYNFGSVSVGFSWSGSSALWVDLGVAVKAH